jgi:transcriptional regulator of acetoin/glycerol metabolism
MDEVGKKHISRILAQTGNNLKMAGKILKMSRTTLWRRIKKYNLADSADS